MSAILHLDPDTAEVPVVGRIESWEAGVQAPHRHERHQLICISNGVIHVTTAVGAWVLPTTRAILISAGTEHEILVKRPTKILVLYIDPDEYELPRDSYCWVLDVTPLMRELISVCAVFPWDYLASGPESRLARVLIDQITMHDHSPVDLPLPIDPRALKVAQILSAKLKQTPTLVG